MMHRKQRQRSRRVMAEINVVPYIDVMLVLLVIFMITTPLLTQGVKINLPSAHAEPLTIQQKQPIIITVNQQGLYFLNIAAQPNQAIAERTLATRLAAQLIFDKQQHIHRPVLVKGDKAVPYGKVVQAMVVAQKAGVKNVGLMTSPGGESANISSNKTGNQPGNHQG